MAQQNYQLNIPFNTYHLSDLRAEDGNDAWTWIGRTLIGYISADGDGNIIQLGQEITVDTPTAELSGIWELNKLDLSIYIIGGGDDSYIEISGMTHELNTTNNRWDYYRNSLPLTNQAINYKITDRAKNGDVFKFWFNSYLSCKIHPGANRTISAVWYDGEAKYHDQAIQPTDHGEISSFTIGYSKYTTTPYIAINENEVISVYLVEGGIMHYHSNKNTVNPYHPTLDD